MDKKKIVQEVKKKINPDCIQYLFWYGDRPGKDISVMAVADKRKIRVRLYEPPKFKIDILTVGKAEFRKGLRMLDPEIIEPLITGFLLLGDKIEVGLLRSRVVLSSSFSEEAFSFLENKSRLRLEDAKKILEASRREDKDNLLSCLVKLSWACSYSDFAYYYRSNSRFVPITFAGLLAQDGQGVLGEVMRVLKAVKFNGGLDRTRVVNLFEKTQTMLGVVN